MDETFPKTPARLYYLPIRGMLDYWDEQHFGAVAFNMWEYNKNLQRFILNALEGKKRVCDFGCGNGSLIRFLKKRMPRAEFVGYDNSEIAVRDARNARITARKVDLDGENPFGDEKFDAVVSLTSFEYTNIQESIKSINAALEPRGVFVPIIHRPASYVIHNYHVKAEEDSRIKEFLPQLEKSVGLLKPPTLWRFFARNGFNVELSQDFRIKTEAPGRLLLQGVFARKV